MRRAAALLLVTACSFDSPRVPDDRWWDPAWSMRVRIGIGTQVPLEQGFQLGLPRDLDATPCAGPRDQIRVVHGDAAELPRVIDELGGDEWIWFRLAAPLPAMTGPSEYWLYCGNPGAGPAPSDPASVFDLHDEFDGSSLSPAWRSQGQVSFGSGAVGLAGNNATIRSEAMFGPGTAVDYVLTLSSGARGNPLLWGGFGTGFSLGPPAVAWYAYESNAIRQASYRVGQQGPSATNGRTLGPGPDWYGVERFDTYGRYRHDNVAVGMHSYGGSISEMMNVRIHNLQSGGGIQVHMVRVRKAVDPIPEVALGAFEERP